MNLPLPLPEDANASISSPPKIKTTPLLSETDLRVSSSTLSIYVYIDEEKLRSLHSRRKWLPKGQPFPFEENHGNPSRLEKSDKKGCRKCTKPDEMLRFAPRCTALTCAIVYSQESGDEIIKIPKKSL